MKKMLAATAATALLAFCSTPVLAQTADEVIEKHLAASGGREALGKIASQVSSGSIALTTPVGELQGTVEVYNKPPNKSRTLIKLDLTSLGAGEVVVDQRFDGVTGYQLDSVNGNREITGGQLDAMRNTSFPSPLLGYSERGTTVALSGRERVGERDAYVIVLTPKSGSATRAFIDAGNFMLVKTITTVDVPELGGDIEQVVEFSDFHDVDGIQVPYSIRATNPAQTVRATLKEVHHNVVIDDDVFVRPAGQ